MNLGKPPLSVLVLSCLYMAVGAIGFAYHFPRPPAFHHEDVWIEASELLAFVAGVFMLRGHNWARLARGSVDGLLRSDQLPRGSPNCHPFLVSGCDCLGSLSISGERASRENGKERGWRRLTRLELVHMQNG